MRGNSHRLARALSAVLLVGTGVILATWSPSRKPSPPGPLADRFALEEGGTLYRKHCAPCHGPGGRGDGQFFASSLSPIPADLTSAEFAQNRSDAELARAISQGSATMGKSNLCPAWGRTFSPAEIEYLVAFIRKLQQAVTPGPAG